jgi:hypothetical protein
LTIYLLEDKNNPDVCLKTRQRPLWFLKIHKKDNSNIDK